MLTAANDALDKFVGALAQNAPPLRDNILVQTGRLSVELVQKACAAGATMIVAVSAPTALAIPSPLADPRRSRGVQARFIYDATRGVQRAKRTPSILCEKGATVTSAWAAAKYNVAKEKPEKAKP